MDDMTIGAYTVMIPEGAANMYLEKEDEGVMLVSDRTYLFKHVVAPILKSKIHGTEYNEEKLIEELDSYWNKHRELASV